VSFLRKSIEKIQVSLKFDKKNGYLYEDRCTYLIISRSVLHRMRNISERPYRESQNLHFVLNIFFKSRSLRDKVKSIVELDRSHMTIRRMRIAFWVPKATNTQSEYVMLVVFHSSNGCTIAPPCFAIRTLPFLLTLIIDVGNYDASLFGPFTPGMFW